MAEELHSKYSASNAAGWMRCAGRLVMCEGLPNVSTKYADEGTAAHELAKWCLLGWSRKAHEDGTWPTPTTAFEGRVITVGEREFVVDEDMMRDVQVYVDNIADYAIGADMVMVEVRVNYSRAIGVEEDEGWGTSDVMILKMREIQVHDLKYGQGEEVDAEDNEQCQLYGLGGFTQFDGLVQDYDVVRMVIHQVRKSHKPKEVDRSVDQLKAFGELAAERVRATQWAQISFTKNVAVPNPTMTQEDWEWEFLSPGEKQCRWCRAKATCGERRRSISRALSESSVDAAVVNDFADLDTPDALQLLAEYRKSIRTAENEILSKMMSLAPEVEGWITAVRAEMESRLLSGVEFEDWKIVQGRRGHRAWENEEEAEKLMKSFRLKMEEMYKMDLISPAQAEKLAPRKTKRSPKGGQATPVAKTPIGEKQWAKLSALIYQPEGAKHVAPKNDEREAIKITPIADEFPDIVDDGSEHLPADFSDLA